MALAMKAAAHIAGTVDMAETTCPVKVENTVMADPMNTIETSGKPRRLARTDASVCSSHVIGSQYGAWDENLTLLR